MKKILLITALLGTAFVATARKQPVDTFPDGTPVGEWFKDYSVKEPAEHGKLYNIRDYGAVSSPQVVQTQLIQSVIDSAATHGGGVVVIPEGIYKSGSLFFRQGTHLYLSRGAVLLGSESVLDFPVIDTRIEGQICKYFGGLINASGLDGFSITGPGTIDGNGSVYWRLFRLRRQWNPKCTNKDEQRPRLILLSNCTNVTLADVTLQNSPFWHTHLYKCTDTRIMNLRIFAPAAPVRSASTDGIDLDVCSNILVKGCRITVNDDAICFKGGKGPWADTDPDNGPNSCILVEDCFFDNTTGSCITCGSESIKTFNILVRNCKADNARALLQLKMRPDTPQRYEFITIDGVTGSCTTLLKVAPWTQFYDPQGRKDIPVSEGGHIVFRNINMECTKAFADISGKSTFASEDYESEKAGTEDYRISDFTFENVTVTAPVSEWNRTIIKGLKLKNTFLNGVKQ